MTSDQVRQLAKRTSTLAAATVMVLVACGQAAPAQETEPASDAKQLIAAVYEKTKTAKSAEQIGEIIELCTAARKLPLSEAQADYLQKLLSWAHNRRGELFIDQLSAAADGNQAEQLSRQALTDFEASVKLDDTRWKSLLNRGVSYAEFGRLEDAQADLTRVVQLNSAYANAWYSRGEIFYELGEYQKAIDDFGRLLRMKPNDFDAHTSLGHAYLMLEEFASAVRHYDQAVRLQPENAHALTNRGNAYHRRGQWDRAGNDYLAAIALDDKLGRAYQSGAWLLATCPIEAVRNPERSVAAAEKAIELDGDQNYQYLDTLAAAYARAGQFDKAKAAIRKALSLAPESEREILGKRQALYEAGKPYDQFMFKKDADR